MSAPAESVPAALLVVRDAAKSFTLHDRGVTRSVLRGVSLTVHPGECIGLTGPSGSGKSTLMRMIYGSYRTFAGEIRVRHGEALVDVARADPWTILDLRRSTIGYVSQFLRVLPRIAAIDVVAAPLLDRGLQAREARRRAAAMLARLGIARTLWDLSPLTFSGGEQQRVNIARGFVAGYPVMLLDEPTASLDGENSALVLEVIQEATARGTAIVGIFHDRDARECVVTRSLDIGKAQSDSCTAS